MRHTSRRRTAVECELARDILVWCWHYHNRSFSFLRRCLSWDLSPSPDMFTCRLLSQFAQMRLRVIFRWWQIGQLIVSSGPGRNFILFLFLAASCCIFYDRYRSSAIQPWPCNSIQSAPKHKIDKARKPESEKTKERERHEVEQTATSKVRETLSTQSGERESPEHQKNDQNPTSH